MEEDNLPEISYYLRVLQIGHEEEDNLLSLVETDLVRRRALGNDVANLIFRLLDDKSAALLGLAISNLSLSKKCDLFISLLPASDSGIKELPRFISKLVVSLDCDLLVSYTFTNEQE